MIENNKSINIASLIVLVAGILFIMIPIVIAFLTATITYSDFVQQGGIGLNIGGAFFDNMRKIFTETLLVKQVWNSLIISILVAVMKCAFAFTATFAIVFFDNRLNRWIFALALMTLFIPTELIVITTYKVVSNVADPLNWFLRVTRLSEVIGQITGSVPNFKLNLLNTSIGVAAPIATSATSVFIYRQFFLSLPKDLGKAAIMDGAGPLRFMIDIVLPLSWTPLIATFMFWFIGGWTSYLWPLIATTTPESQPAIVGLSKLASTDFARIPDVPMLMAGAIFVSFFPVLLIAFMQRQIIRGLNLSEK